MTAPATRTAATYGCATYGVPPWARVFLQTAVCFARLAPGQDQYLLACLHDRTHLLRVAEAARLCPPQPPAAQGTGRTQWDWRERESPALRHGADAAPDPAFALNPDPDTQGRQGKTAPRGTACLGCGQPMVMRIHENGQARSWAPGS
jgi:hypothetical protein